MDSLIGIIFSNVVFFHLLLLKHIRTYQSSRSILKSTSSSPYKDFILWLLIKHFIIRNPNPSNWIFHLSFRNRQIGIHSKGIRMITGEFRIIEGHFIEMRCSERVPSKQPSISLKLGSLYRLVGTKLSSNSNFSKNAFTIFPEHLTSIRVDLKWPTQSPDLATWVFFVGVRLYQPSTDRTRSEGHQPNKNRQRSRCYAGNGHGKRQKEAYSVHE